MLTAFLSFLGVVIGASLQFYFTRHIENQRHLRELRSKAYMDYLNCVSQQAQFHYKEDSKERRALFAKTGDAKARICLYGSNKAIHEFSNFEKLGATMSNSESRDVFTKMVSIMRYDSGSETGVFEDELQNVLLGHR